MGRVGPIKGTRGYAFAEQQALAQLKAAGWTQSESLFASWGRPPQTRPRNTEQFHPNRELHPCITQNYSA